MMALFGLASGQHVSGWNQEPLGGFERTLKRSIPRQSCLPRPSPPRGFFVPARTVKTHDSRGSRRSPPVRKVGPHAPQVARTRGAESISRRSVTASCRAMGSRVSVPQRGSREAEIRGNSRDGRLGPPEIGMLTGTRRIAAGSDQREGFMITGRRYLFSPFRFATKDR